METQVLGLLQLILTKTGIPPEVGLLLFLIGMIIIGYKKILKPMYEKVKKIPTEESVKQAINESNKVDSERLDIITKKLDAISETLNNAKQVGDMNDTGIHELKHDVDFVKQLLSQFQGHLLYSKTNNNNFGNKELK